MRERSRKGRTGGASIARRFSTAKRFRRRRRLAMAGALLVALTSLVPVLLLRSGGESVGEPESGREPNAAASGSTSQSPVPAKLRSAQARFPKQAAVPAREPLPEPAASCDDPRVLVDRDNPLPPGYAPSDLTSLHAWGVPTLEGDLLLREEAAQQLGLLVADAGETGEELIVSSAYRSYYDQQASYANWTGYYGEGAGGVSAPPGHSQHQLGTAVDFTNAAAGYKLWWGFGDTSASTWLLENAHRYGYAIAYPSVEEYDETGYSWEPWHYRYIGVENARRWKESGLNLQAFLQEEGVLPLCG